MIFPVLPGKRKMKHDLSQKNTLKYDIFCKCSEKIVFPKKLLVLSRNIVFLFPKNMILFSYRKWKIIFLKKRGINTFYIFGKDGIYFSYKYDIILLLKKQRSSSLNIHLKMTFSVSSNKMIFILENMTCLLIEKSKMIRKLVQSNTSRITISIFMSFFKVMVTK